MKILSLLLSCGLLLADSVHGVETARRASADKAWAELEQPGLVDGKLPANYRTMSGRQFSDWKEAQAYELQAKGLAFFHNYPADPRRWKVVLAMVNAAPRFIVGYGPRIETDSRDVISNAAAVAAWQACLRNMTDQMRAANDVPAGLLETLAYREFMESFAAAERAAGKGQTVDWTAMLKDAEDFIREYPTGRFAATAVRMALGRLARSQSAAESRKLLRRFAAHTNAEVANYAQGSLRTMDLAATPMELRFTAVDGREVDLAKLRGKVVLVDFWATWCGPCITELPNVKKVYAEYNDKGFEIVGIALESARVLPNDTPEQAAAKLERAKKKLTDFTAKEDMPWPQYFDGKHWQTEISKHFGVTSIPAMFLLDREGKLVSTNARGEALEAEVRRLLRL